jgi:hypothetical protein
VSNFLLYLFNLELALSLTFVILVKQARDTHINGAIKMRKEITSGTSGNGQTSYHVLTFNAAGDITHIENFTTLAEAQCWIRFA